MMLAWSLITTSSTKISKIQLLSSCPLSSIYVIALNAQDERRTSSGRFDRTLFRRARGRYTKGRPCIADFIQLRGRIGVYCPCAMPTSRKKRYRGLQQQLDTARHHRPIISCTEARSEHHCRRQRTWSDRRNEAAPLHNGSRYAHGIREKVHRQSRNIRPRCPP